MFAPLFYTIKINISIFYHSLKTEDWTELEDIIQSANVKLQVISTLLLFFECLQISTVYCCSILSLKNLSSRQNQMPKDQQPQ